MPPPATLHAPTPLHALPLPPPPPPAPSQRSGSTVQARSCPECYPYPALSPHPLAPNPAQAASSSRASLMCSAGCAAHPWRRAWRSTSPRSRAPTATSRSPASARRAALCVRVCVPWGPCVRWAMRTCAWLRASYFGCAGLPSALPLPHPSSTPSGARAARRAPQPAGLLLCRHRHRPRWCGRARALQPRHARAAGLTARGLLGHGPRHLRLFRSSTWPSRQQSGA